MDKKDKPIVSMSNEEREELWDDTYAKEKGVVLEFNMETQTGKVRSLQDSAEYKIDGRELVRTKIELHAGDKILFAPIEHPDGDDYARIISIVELPKWNVYSGVASSYRCLGFFAKIIPAAVISKKEDARYKKRVLSLQTGDH